MVRFEDFVRDLQLTESFRDAYKRLHIEIANRYNTLVSKANEGTLFKEYPNMWKEAAEFFSSSLKLSDYVGEVVTIGVHIVHNSIVDTVSLGDEVDHEPMCLGMDNYEACIAYYCLESDGFSYTDEYVADLGGYFWYFDPDCLSGVLKEYYDLCRNLYTKVENYCDEFLRGRELPLDDGGTIPADSPEYYSYQLYLKHFLFSVAVETCLVGDSKTIYEFLTMDADAHFIYKHIARYLISDLGMFIKPFSLRDDEDYAEVFEDLDIDECAVFTEDTLKLTAEDCQDKLYEIDFCECYLVAIGFTSKAELQDYWEKRLERFKEE